MRIAFVGTSNMTVGTARHLVEGGHEIVIIEKDKEKIDRLSDELDCGFLHGDGSSPSLLREVGPAGTDILFCLTGNDKDNMIAGLVGRSLGFSRVVIKVEDLDLEHICTELGLEDIIVPTRTISRYLADMVNGQDVNALSNVIKGKARFYSFIAGKEEDRRSIGKLDLPDSARAICYYRQSEFHLAGRDSEVRQGDEIVLLTDSDTLEKLKKRWTRQVPVEENGAV